jgi:transcriptional regulator with XRE-family HTH domain
MKFHERLKQIRQKRNISIRRLCSDLSLQKSTYENWEMSVYPSRPESYKMLAEYLEVPLEYLMFGERKNTEWDEATFHLRTYLEEFISSQLRKMFEEQEQKGGPTLGQGRVLLS